MPGQQSYHYSIISQSNSITYEGRTDWAGPLRGILSENTKIFWGSLQKMCSLIITENVFSVF